MTRVGIIGYGLAGEVFHAPLVDAVEGLEVAAIVTRDPDRQRRAAAAYPEARVVPDVEELWSLAEVVVVASSNRSHVPLALAAVERGLPVVVDKPLSPSLSEAERLVAAAEERGVLLTVFQNRRLDDDFLTVRRLIDGIGTPLRLESRFERFEPELSGGWRELGDPAEGGGLLLDLGSHLIDQARLLLGPVRRVYAELDRRRGGAEADDDTFLALEHAGGARSHLWMSALAPLRGPRLRLSGADGGVETFGLDPQEEQLAQGLRPGDDGWGLRGAAARVVAGDGEREEPLTPGAYELFYAGLREALDTGGAPPVDPHDALTTLRVIEAALRSAAKRTVIEIEEKA